jgi:O-6-methylguanine DNA methyltransferase
MSSRSREKTRRQTSGGAPQDTIFVGQFSTRRFPRIWVAASQEGLIALDLGARRDEFEAALARRTKRTVVYSPEQLRDAAVQIREYLRGRRRSFQVRIDWSAIRTSFQRRALGAVLSIPYGQTRSYKQIAAQIGRPRSIRAVGRANATNPLPLIIPCHRVIGADGSLRGYGAAGGLATKAWLLNMEASRARQPA